MVLIGSDVVFENGSKFFLFGSFTVIVFLLMVAIVVWLTVGLWFANGSWLTALGRLLWLALLGRLRYIGVLLIWLSGLTVCTLMWCVGLLGENGDA